MERFFGKTGRVLLLTGTTLFLLNRLAGNDRIGASLTAITLIAQSLEAQEAYGWFIPKKRR